MTNKAALVISKLSPLSALASLIIVLLIRN